MGEKPLFKRDYFYLSLKHLTKQYPHRSRNPLFKRDYFYVEIIPELKEELLWVAIPYLKGIISTPQGRFGRKNSPQEVAIPYLKGIISTKQMLACRYKWRVKVAIPYLKGIISTEPFQFT